MCSLAVNNTSTATLNEKDNPEMYMIRMKGDTLSSIHRYFDSSNPAQADDGTFMTKLIPLNCSKHCYLKVKTMQHLVRVLMNSHNFMHIFTCLTG